MSNETDRLVRAAEFMRRLGIKKTKFYDAKKAGIIPPPIYISKALPVWHESVVTQTVNAFATGRLSL